MEVGGSVMVAVALGEGVSTGGSVSVGAGADAAISAANVAATKFSISSSERVGAAVDCGVGVSHAIKNTNSPNAAVTTPACLTHTV